jgi:hypothetical protein
MKISNTSITTYNTCNFKYKLHYRDRLRSQTTSAALLYGSALDAGLNELLTSRSLDQAKFAFDHAWQHQDINGVRTYLPTSLNVKYSKKDLDLELITEEDAPLSTDNLSWLSLRYKGHLALTAYFSKVLPQITSVLSVQKPFTMENGDGDSITGFIDAIVQIGDKKYLVDHKSSSVTYESDSAGKSQQLVTYYYSEKDEYKLDGVGFIVMYKTIEKNRKKICSVCQFDGSSTKHKLCNNLVAEKRCNGEYIETISPECKIDIILNKVETTEEDNIINTFDTAVLDIKAERFEQNREACIDKFGKCQFYAYCHYGNEEGLITLPEREQK